MNVFKQFIKSLYSPRDIALFRFQGIGKTILYVFLLTLLSIIPTVTYLSSSMVNGVNLAQSTIDNELPDFTIENGLLSSQETSPVVITRDHFSIIFDSTGEMSTDELEQMQNGMALLKHDFAIITGGVLDTYSYSMVSDLVITKSDVAEFLANFDSLLVIIIPIFIVVIYIFSSGVKFIEVTVLALLGLALKNILGRNVQYRQLWRMAAYSVTLPTVFFTIMAALKTTVPNGFLLNWFISLLMLYLALREVPKRKEG